MCKMGIRIENHCCDCAVPGFPCQGKLCPNREVEVRYCDHCDEEICGDVYKVDGEDLCEYCLKEKFREE